MAGLLSDAERAQVSAAVSRAEALSSGEIVTIVARQSSGYADIALAWAAFVALFALGWLAAFAPFYMGLVDRITGHWARPWTPREIFELAALAAAAKFLGMWLIQLWQPLRLWLVPRRIRAGRARARAITCFRIGAERRTHGRTGILIYLSLAEHRAEIVADSAIATRVSPEVWGEAMAALLGPVRQGRIGDGMAAAVEKVGAVLAEHFPRASNDINELPDRLIEV